MKKSLGIILGTGLIIAALTGCSSKTAEKTTAAGETATVETETDGSKAEEKTADSELGGTVATDGSTSMEKVIGALGESFMAENGGVTFTYNPTGSGSGIQAVQEGRCDIGL